jgi:zinc protease
MNGSWTREVRREVLPNGLTVLVHHDPKSPAVGLVTEVRAGFLDEPDEWAGISHVLEHMVFKGTSAHGPGELARRIKAAGGYLNAGTGYDSTHYYAVLPAGSVAEGMALMADAIRNVALDAGELRRELQVILEEARRKRDTPSSVVYETMFAVLFDHHRIRRWRIGDEARLATFTRDEVAEYYRSRYLPSRTILAVAGGAPVEQVMALARTHFGDWSGAELAIPPGPEEPWRREVRARTLRGDVTQADLMLGWRTVPTLHPGTPALRLAAAVLSWGRASWLQRELREPGTVLSVSADQFALPELGVFSVNADLDPAKLEEALRGIARTLERLRVSGPATEDLERARAMLLVRLAQHVERPESRAGLLAESEMLRDVAWIEEWIARIRATTPEEVRAAAEEWLRPDAVAGVVYLPEGAGQELTPSLLQESFAPRTRSRPRAFRGKTLVCELPGADLLVRRTRGVGLVSAGLFRLRRTRELPGEAGLGTLAVRSMVRGAGGLDAAGLAAAVERFGGAIEPSVSADQFGFTATVLADHAVAVVGLLRRVLLEPAFAPEAVAVERDTLAREAAQVSDNMFRFPFQMALGAAFGDTGYGVPTIGTPASVPALTDAQVRGWHTAELEAGRTLAVVVGDVDPKRVAGELGELLEAMPGGARPAVPLSPEVHPRPGDSVRVQERQRAQTAIAMVFPGPARTDPSRFAAEVWASVAGGLGGRLFEALRGRRSLAYTVTASSWQRLGAGALRTYIATSPEREEEAREQMLAELGRFRRDGITEAELTRAVNYLTGQEAVNRQVGGTIQSELVDRWMAGEAVEAFEDPEQPYRAVTTDAVRAVLDTCLDPARRAEGVVRGVGTGNREQGTGNGGE